MSEDDKSDDLLHIATGISTDQAKFLRRTCPSCGRDFKTDINQAQLQWAIAPAVQRIGPEIGLSLETNGESQDDNSEYLYCPYCEVRSAIAETFTEETVRYLRNILWREYVLPQINRVFSPLSDMGRSSGGLFSVTFEYNRGILPPRPLHGPELPDMKVIDFLCCGRKAKIAEHYDALAHCIYCGGRVVLI